MKILFVNTNIGYGGASKMLVWVANQASLSGHDVTIFTYRDNTICQEVSPRITLIHKTLENANRKGGVVKTVKEIHNLIVNENIDIGVAFLSPSILRLAIASKFTSVKLLFSHRADPYYKNSLQSFKSKIVDYLNEWAFRQADAYVFQSEMARAYYEKKLQDKSVVIPNPVKMKRTEIRNGHVRKSLVSIGRLDLKQKRQDIMIDAFNLISAKYPDFTLEIYGDGEDEEKIKRLIAENPKILLKGKTSDVVTVLQNAWAMVLSSDFEGIPNALLESMALGVPSISTDCSPGGAAMLIHNMENGMLTPRGDVSALAEAMEYVITHPEEAEKMGVQAMKVNALYAENVIADNWKRVFNKLMQ